MSFLFRKIIEDEEDSKSSRKAFNEQGKVERLNDLQKKVVEDYEARCKENSDEWIKSTTWYRKYLKLPSTIRQEEKEMINFNKCKCKETDTDIYHINRRLDDLHDGYHELKDKIDKKESTSPFSMQKYLAGHKVFVCNTHKKGLEVIFIKENYSTENNKMALICVVNESPSFDIYYRDINGKSSVDEMYDLYHKD